MPAISSALIARLRAAADPAADRELLRAFLADRSEPAFAALVRRHGPMVLGVCRRVLGNPHDADDAFQATFLVLARKANAVGQPDHLPGWLHTIAVRTATEIRRMRTRRRKVEVANHECLASECLASRERQRPEGFPLADAPGSPEQSELAALLDEELSRLPEHYRVPVVLCELQGLPRKEAAARLKLPEGTLSSRLAKARKLLADRLTRRGVTATTATITAVLAREATATVPAALAVEAARAALIPAASAVAAQVADGVIKALFVSKLKGVTLAVGMAVLCVGGAVTLPGGLGASNVASVPDESKPEALVQQLGSDSPTDRDAAEKQLRAMGARALPAVIAGAASSDAEFARRCRSIAAALRADIRTAFHEEFRANGTGTYTHPVWKRYRIIAGDSAASRTLFAAIISDPQRFQRLDDAESDPMAAINAYKTEIARLAASNRAKQDPDASQLPDIAECLLLGSQTITAKAVPHRPPGASVCAERFALLGPRLWKPDALNGPSREPVARLYAAWCDRRALPDVLQFGLDRAINWRISETLPTARRVAQTKDAALPLRASALTLLAHFGTEATDAPAAEVLMDNETVIHTVTYQGVGYITQMRDVATAVRVKLAGRNPKEFGFQTVTGTAFDWSQTPIPAANAFPRGFPTEAARTTAHEKATAFLANHSKPDPKPDPAAAKLVKQLGSPNFADRDAAEKKLKEFGLRAKSAVIAGTKDTDAEIARRSATILDHIRTADRAEFAKQFRDAKDGPLTIDHPAWKRFREITGDTKEARALFIEVIADDIRFRRLDDAEANPADAARLYAAQFPTDVIDPANLAAALLLGTFPKTAMKLQDRREERLDRRKGFVEALTGPHAGPLHRLYPAWLSARTDADVIAAGLETARSCDVKECLPLARKLAAEPKVGIRNRADALLVVGQFGGPEDIALARPLLTETSRYGTFLVGDPARAQVKDIAAAAMLMVHDRNPSEFGFRCTVLPSKAKGWTGRHLNIWGFPSEEARAAGHRAVLAFIEAAAKLSPPKPERATPAGKPADLKQFLADFRADEAGVKDFDHPLWKRFTAAVGKDQSARALFAALVADPDRAERLAAATTDPASAGKLYAAEVGRVRKFSDDFNEAISVRWKEIADPAERTRAMMNAHQDTAANPPVGEVAAILFLGTLPSTADVSLGERPKRLGLDVSPVGLPMRVNDKFAWGPAIRRLFVSWLTARHLTEDQENGLAVASTVGIHETLPLARRWAADPLKTPKVRGHAVAVIGQFGTAADRPLADALHDDGTPVGRSLTVVQVVASEKKQSPTYSATVGDVALAVSVHLAGGDPFAFGCGPPDKTSLNLAWGSLAYFGFADEESRNASHDKAKAWLANHSKPDPKPNSDAAKLVKQLGSPNFADRDAAEKKLKQLGPRAKAAVTAGTKDTDAEIARRSATILDHIRREQAWPRFAKLLGDDEHARTLFNAVWAVPRNVELIEKAQEHPESVARLYTDREKEMNEQCRNPDKESWHPGKVSVGEVAGWMYLGTFPGAEKGGSRNVFLLDFPDMWLHPSKPYPFPAALGEGPYKVGARRILVKWTETRIGRPDFSKGLNGAIAYSIPEIVPVAKRYLTEVKQIDDNHRHCLVTIGKCGTKADLPFLARFADDRRVASSAFVNYPGDEANPPREFRPGKDQETQMRDLAMAMTLVLNGATRQQLDEFGFFVSRYWPRYSGAAGPPAPLPPVGKRPLAGDNTFTPSDIGFIHDADREAAHKKAKAWLTQESRSQ